MFGAGLGLQGVAARPRCALLGWSTPPRKSGEPADASRGSWSATSRIVIQALRDAEFLGGGGLRSHWDRRAPLKDRQHESERELTPSIRASFEVVRAVLRLKPFCRQAMPLHRRVSPALAEPQPRA